MGDAQVERFHWSGRKIGGAVLEAQKEEHARGEAGGVVGFDEAAESALIAVDAGGEGAEVAFDEGVGGVGEEVEDWDGAVLNITQDSGDNQGGVGSCAQQLRVLADQELENGGIGAIDNSVMKGHEPTGVRDGQQAPIPRVGLGPPRHQLNEFQWRLEVTSEHDRSHSSAALYLVE